MTEKDELFRHDYTITRAVLDLFHGDPSDIGDEAAKEFADRNNMLIRERTSRMDEEGNMVVTYWLIPATPENKAKNPLPNSMDEKNKGDGIERWMFMHELRSLLEQFRSNDWVIVNEVGNIKIYREGTNDSEFWIVNMRDNKIEHYAKKKVKKNGR